MVPFLLGYFLLDKSYFTYDHIRFIPYVPIQYCCRIPVNGKKDYLTIPEAAKICSVGRTTMWRWVRSGVVKSSMTLGGQHRIRKSDLDAVLAENHAHRAPLPGTESKPQPSSQFTRHHKILVVDDEPQVLKMTARILEAKGYEIENAADGFEAGIQVLEFKPDLVFLDLYIPGMDGFEVCRKIKENPKTAIIVVVAVTGYDNDENRERIMKAGADGYLTKPVERKHLLESISTLISNLHGVKKCA